MDKGKNGLILGNLKKSKPTVLASIDDYIANFPENVQKIMMELRVVINASAPDAEETISYCIPAFTLEGPLVYFAAYKNHIGFYPTSSGIAAFKQELSAYKGGRGSIKFPIDHPLPLQLIGRIVRFRVAENLEKAAARSREEADAGVQ